MRMKMLGEGPPPLPLGYENYGRPRNRPHVNYGRPRDRPHMYMDMYMDMDMGWPHLLGEGSRSPSR